MIDKDKVIEGLMRALIDAQARAMNAEKLVGWYKAKLEAATAAPKGASDE